MSAPKVRNWTVARFPNGHWTTGGRPTDPDYADCEVWVIPATSREAAKKEAQTVRRRQIRAAAQKREP